MKHLSESLMLLRLIYITSLPVLEANHNHVSSLTGYLGQDVTLPCGFVKEPNINITQVQWNFKRPEGEELRIIVFNPHFGINISESPMMDRLDINEHSLIIKNLVEEDSGFYTCKIAAFPTGSFESVSKLIVQEQSSPWWIFAVLAATLLLATLAVVAYITFRCGSSVRYPVNVDASGAMMDGPSDIAGQEDVVYSHVKLNSSQDNATFHSHTEIRTVNDGGDSDDDYDVTYSEVVVLRQQPQEDAHSYIQEDYDII